VRNLPRSIAISVALLLSLTACDSADDEPDPAATPDDDIEAAPEGVDEQTAPDPGSDDVDGAGGADEEMADIALQPPLADRAPLASTVVPVTASDHLDEITVAVVSFENLGDGLLRMVVRWTPDRAPDDVDEVSATTLSEFLGGAPANGITPYLVDAEHLLEYRPIRTDTPNGTSRRFEGGAAIETVYYYQQLDPVPDALDVRIEETPSGTFEIETIRDIPFDPAPVDTPIEPPADGPLASLMHPVTARDELEEMVVSLLPLERIDDERMRLVLRFTPDRFPDAWGVTLTNALGRSNASDLAPIVIDPYGMREYRPARAGLRNGTSRTFVDERPIEVAYELPLLRGDPPTVEVRFEDTLGLAGITPLRDVPVTFTDVVDPGSAPAEAAEGVLTPWDAVRFDPGIYDADAPPASGEALERFITDLPLPEPRDLAPETREEGTTTVAVAADVLFAFASAELTERAEGTIRGLAAGIEGDGPIEVVGHTDSVGPDEVNEPLSEARAEAVANVLREELGADRRILVEGRGSTDPAVDEVDEQAAARNRRVEISHQG